MKASMMNLDCFIFPFFFFLAQSVLVGSNRVSVKSIGSNRFGSNRPLGLTSLDDVANSIDTDDDVLHRASMAALRGNS